MKRIVRNMSVFSSESVLMWAGVDSERKQSTSTIEHVLADIFHEQTDYQSLLRYYGDALKGIENTYFSYAHFLDAKHAIQIGDNGQILLYYYQDQINIGIPWVYPHQITQIGMIEKAEGSKDVILNRLLNDLQTLSVLSFLLKYYLRMPQTECCVLTTENGCLVNDFLQIILDSHITFTWDDSLYGQQDLYIADAWWYTNDDIMRDLTTMNLLEFGGKYTGFWGR